MKLLVGAAICLVVSVNTGAGQFSFSGQAQPHTKDAMADSETPRGDHGDTSMIPEPATLVLLAAGLLGVARASRRMFQGTRPPSVQ